MLLNNAAAKPAREVKAGDTLRITTEGGDFTVEGLSLTGSGVMVTPRTFVRSESQGQPYNSPFMDSIDRVRGMDITIVTTATTDAEGRALLRKLGFPFKES